MEEINIQDLLKYFYSKILIIIFITIFAGLIGSAYSLWFQTPMYKSTTKLLLANVSEVDSSSSSNLSTDITLNQKLVATYRELIKSRKILKQVTENLNLDYDVEELGKLIEVSSITDTQIILINVKNENSSLAMKIANEVAKVFCEETENYYKISNVMVVEEAEISPNPYNVNILKQVIIYLAIGLVLSCAIVFVIYYFDTTIKTKEEVEEKVGLPVLGLLPLKKDMNKNDLIVVSSPKSLISEGFKTLRTNLQFSKIDGELKTIAVVSSMQGEGKSFTSSNLACAFAQAGERVLLIDCDMRRGRLHRVFGVSNENGFSNLLIDNIKNADQYIQKTEIKNLSVIPMGTIPPNPSELLASSKNAKLMEYFKEKFDIIIYDCVPVTGLTDSLIMAKLVDATVVESSVKITPIELLQTTKKSLINVGANIAGVVLNRIETETSVYSSKYYGKYYQ